MACNHWEEKGLLYTAGELDDDEQNAYKQHCATCDYCQNEIQVYYMEKKNLFLPEMFEDEPSSSVDKEIIRVCSQPIKPAVTAVVFPSLIKNTIFALLILAVGFGGGAYFAGLKATTDIKRAEIAPTENQKIASEQNKTQTSSQVASSQNSADNSLADSLNSDSTRIFKRGNLNVQGVVPVDLTDE